MQWLALHNLWIFSMIPVILVFYLLKRKYEDYEVSSSLLWNQMLREMEANRPWQKLQRNLLLFLQLLVAMLLIIALLRPAVPYQGLVADHTIMVFDVSGSMLATEASTTRFDLAKKNMKDRIEHMTSKQKITIIKDGAIPEIIIAGSSSKNELLEAIDKVQPNEGINNDDATFSLARAIAAQYKNSGIMWFSDGASSQLLSGKESLPENITFQHIQIGKNNENLSLATFVTQQQNDHSMGFIRIDNRGTKLNGGNLSIYNQKLQIIHSVPFEVESGGSYSLTLDNLPLSEVYFAEIEASNDALTQDNQLWSVPFTQQKIKAVLVNSSVGSGHFLSQALQAGQSIELNKTNELPSSYRKDVDFWVFNQIVPEVLPKGNMLIINPRNSTNWLSITGEARVTKSFKESITNHPLLQHLEMNEVHIEKLTNLKPIPNIVPIIQSGDTPVLMAGTFQGRRMIILNFDLSNSDFPLRTAFPIFIQNSIEWLSPNKSLPIESGTPQERITISFMPGTKDKIVITPSGKEITLDASSSNSEFLIPNEIGLYTVSDMNNGQEEKRYFSVQLNEKETDIKPQLISINHQEMAVHQPSTNLFNDVGYQELFPWFVLLALMFAFAEWVVYKRGY